ncbi:SixA phosphatase family protein [Kangiella shandongensis]|uniref:SixA phosphatase family protein n=1 Tax=Kangiella shandongensis TaxID=2763258 RepID=UPI001CBBB2CF|nr:histidine phosphatase family protein [Kangiella shandongensis]
MCHISIFVGRYDVYKCHKPEDLNVANKKLYIFRHGKSDWKAKFKNDYERPLAERGIEAAKNMGAHMKKVGQTPDCIMSSSAKRSFDTINLAMEFGQWESSLTTTRSLYLGSVEETIELIQSFDGDEKRLMIVSHEPLCSALLAELTMGTHIKFPTASVARVDFKVSSWADVDSDKGQLAWLLTPKSIFGK